MEPERNRGILRRTLSAISFLYSCSYAFLALSATAVEGTPRLFDRGTWTLLLAGQAALLAAAGTGLWKPRRWGWPATGLASATSIAFAWLQFRHVGGQGAVMDAVYPPVAAGIWLATRRRP